MKQLCLLPLFLILALFFGSDLQAEGRSKPLKKTEILNVGSISYPIDIEERSDIPFKLLVDNEYKKQLGDSIDYEKYRPAAIFFEAGFTLPNQNKKKKEFAYITINILHGKYQFPNTLSKSQEDVIYNNIKTYTENNLKGTNFTVSNWSPLKFNTKKGIPSLEYYYEQTSSARSQTNIITTNLYYSDIQVQIVLSAPKDEYKKWLCYYNQMIGTFIRKVDIADKFTFEYPTTLKDSKDIPFKYLVDNEFKKILGDSIDYETFRPSMLFLDHAFSISDSSSVPAFGNITINITPKITASPISIDLNDIEKNIKQSIIDNLNPTQYKIVKWNSFTQKEVLGLPLVAYSYEQEKMGDTTMVASSIIFDKNFDIQVGMSTPSKDVDRWNREYKNILASFNRIIPVGNVGTLLYPDALEERSDIPFVKLVDEESKRRLGDSINYEAYRPNNLFLRQGFNENDPTQLQSFNSITITTIDGDFSQIVDTDDKTLEMIIKDTEKRNLLNTSYKIIKWDSFDSFLLKNNVLRVSYSFLEKKNNSDPQYICTTYYYTKTSQSRITLTCNKKDFNEWQTIYANLIKSFKYKGLR